jgi:hypothetical protein
MAYLPLINVVPQFFDNLGDPLVGGTLNAYVAGTSTPTNLFSDNTGTIAGTSVTLNSRGEPTIGLVWVDTSVSYKLILKDSTASTIWTEDNISITGIEDGSVTESKIANSAVTASKIASNAVTTTKISDSAITTAKLGDDSVTTAKIVNNAVTTAKLQNNGYELGQRNKIINGGMYISQRGDIFASANGYTLDRWHYKSNGASVAAVAQFNDKPTGSPFQRSLRVDVSTADTSIAAGDYAIVKQPIEAINVYDLIGRTFTLSFWVRSTKTGTHCVSFRNLSNNISYVAEYSVSVSETWEFKTVTVTNGLTTSGTWTWSSTDALQVGFTLAAGSTYQTTKDAWQSGNYIATANQVNCVDSDANTFAIVGVQLELGATNTPFEYRSYDQELAMCQRYYEVGEANSFRYVTTVNAVVQGRGFIVTKRVAPTMTLTPESGTGGTVSSDQTGFYQNANHSANVGVNWVASAEYSITGA